MFDSIGWVEIFVVIIIGIIVIGPEKLPGVIEDTRAAIYAARRAINNAKAELNGELDGLGAEFEDFRKPLNTVTEYAALGPKRAIAKALFDDDEDYLDQFDPKKMMEEDPAAPNHPQSGAERPPAPRGQNELRSNRPAEQPDDKGDYSTGGGFSWADIT